MSHLIGNPATLARLLVLSPLAAALLTWGLGWLSRLKSVKAVISRPTLHSLQNWVTITASMLSLLLALLLAGSAATGAPLRFHWLLVVDIYLDALNIYFVLLVNVVVLVASLYTGQYLEFQARAGFGRRTDPALFHLFFNLFHLTMVLVPMVDNLVVLWIAVELTTLASAYLVGYRRDRPALEAAWKYIIITSTGIIFALLGTLFLANAIPQALARAISPPESMNWSRLVTVAGRFDPNFIKLSFLFILVGYGTKAGLAPMHTWLPDGHGEAPFPISALLSGVLLKSALYAILRFYTLTNLTLKDNGAFTSHILLVAGLFSLALATPFILKDNRFKRILAYHSLEHMGIITFGLGIGGQVALFGALLHALNHAFTKALMFLAFGNVQSNYPQMNDEQEKHYTGILWAMPGTGLLLALGGLALVGSPPFNIFLSEFIILWAAVAQAARQPSLGSILAIILFLLSVMLIFSGLVRHLGRMLLGTPPAEISAGLKAETSRQVLPLALLLLLVLVFGLTVPKLGVFDLPRLLQQSVNIVQCGFSQCL